jgi:hypothetical protein
MNMQQNIEERLWEYIDGLSSAEERSVIEQLLQTDAAWKEKYGELLEVSELLHSSELESPSLRFTKNVMEEITKLHIAPATKTYINKKIIWSIGFFFIVTIIGFLAYGVGQTNWTSPDGESASVIDKLGKIEVGQFFNNTWVNVFMMINLILGLFLLDNYFTNKRKQYRKEA